MIFCIDYFKIHMSSISDMKTIDGKTSNYVSCKKIAVDNKRIIIEIIRRRRIKKRSRTPAYQRLLKKSKKIRRFLETPKLKLRKVSKKAKRETCSLCLQEMRVGNVLHTPCGHSFHLKCMTEMVVSCRGNWWHKCPNCRTDMFNHLMKLDTFAKAYKQHSSANN